MRRYGNDLLNAGSFICCLILAMGSYADEHRFTDYILELTEHLDDGENK